MYGTSVIPIRRSESVENFANVKMSVMPTGGSDDIETDSNESTGCWGSKYKKNNSSGKPNSKDLNVNRYATKKTIAQGMLDIALLTANASQLRYVLSLGEKHEFYEIMLGLIITSITLQLTVAVLSLSLSMARDCCVDDDQYNTSGHYINSFNVVVTFLISMLNVLITGFGVFRDNPKYVAFKK